jgi:hypothetical protein
MSRYRLTMGVSLPVGEHFQAEPYLVVRSTPLAASLSPTPSAWC